MRSATVYSDGSGLAAGGPAGIAFVAHLGGVVLEAALELADATNQQAELLAAAFALVQIEPHDVVLVYSDSQYVVKGMNEWLPGWVERGWLTSSNRPVANRKHWERLLTAAARHRQVTFSWIRGHNGNEWNERADELAGLARLAAEANAVAV